MADYKKYAQDLRRIAQFQNCFECYEGERTEGSCSSRCTLSKSADAIEELLARDVVPADFHERCLQLEIRKRIELEKQLPQWISVEERKPPQEVEQETGKWSKKVWFWCKPGFEAVGYYNYTHDYWMTADEVSDYDSDEVTHWMLRPEPPEGVE